MITSIVTQVTLIIYSLISGLLTGLIYDIYRMLRGFRTPNKFITIIEDLLFWILNTVLVFIFLLYTNNGYIGLYVYFYIFLGIYLQQKIFSKTWMFLQKKMVFFFAKSFRIIINFIFYPLNLIFYKIKAKKQKNSLKKS